MRLAGHVGRWDGPYPNVPIGGTLGSRDRAVFLSQRGRTRAALQPPLTFGTLGQRFWKDKELYKRRFSRPDRAKHPTRQLGRISSQRPNSLGGRLSALLALAAQIARQAEDGSPLATPTPLGAPLADDRPAPAAMPLPEPSSAATANATREV